MILRQFWGILILGIFKELLDFAIIPKIAKFKNSRNYVRMMYHHRISRFLAKAVCIFIFFYFPDSELYYCIKWSISIYGGVTVITSNIILQNNWLMNKMVKPNEDLTDQTSSNCRSPRFKLCFMSVFNLAFFFFFCCWICSILLNGFTVCLA